MCRDIREDGTTQVSLPSGQCRNQVSDIIDSDLHEYYNVREDGTTQVSLSSGQCRNQVSDIIDSDLHERVRELFKRAGSIN